jgi:hypothetical protein
MMRKGAEVENENKMFSSTLEAERVVALEVEAEAVKMTKKGEQAAYCWL